MTYVPRIIDAELDELLPALPALALEGAKGVGKTATALRRVRRTVALDDPQLRAIVSADPAAAIGGDYPLLIDEWQNLPAVWDVIRRAVDAGAPPGSFLLTGSAVPGVDRRPMHSGAGRIDSVRLRPMALSERHGQPTPVRLQDLLEGSATIEGESSLTLPDYADEIVRSGFPAMRALEGRARTARLESYVTRVIDRDIPDELGISVRRPNTLRRWLTAYAAATASTTSLNKIRNAAASGESVPAATTCMAYRDALEQLYILDRVDGWLPTQNRLRRLTEAPKHHLADPALAAHLLGVTADTLLRGAGPPCDGEGPLLGALFESLATLSVRVYAQAAEAQITHMRDHGGRHEVDLIVQRRSGELVAFEVKLSGVVDDRDVRHLLWLRGELGDLVRDVVVLTTGPAAYRRQDGVAVVPLGLLGP